MSVRLLERGGDSAGCACDAGVGGADVGVVTSLGAVLSAATALVVGLWLSRPNDESAGNAP
eukprot:2167032-Lingulodinium_polyedra.AAC.1